MNQAIIHSDHARAASRSRSHKLQSLLDVIVDKLKSALEIRARQSASRYRAQTFIDASLLDPVMGPEISRTLRR